jgi:hypothetical protein
MCYTLPKVGNLISFHSELFNYLSDAINSKISITCEKE